MGRSCPAIREEGDVILITRRQNETELEYHRRLVYGKLVDKTLADVDYSEIAEAIYGQPYSSDVARRMLYGSRNTLEVLDKERAAGIEGVDIAEEIEAKTSELRAERQKFFDQRREFNKQVTFDSRREHLYETLAAAAQHLEETVGNIWNDIPTLPTCNGTGDDNEAVLIFSDWHYGLVCENAFNNYDTAVCRDRVKQVVRDACERIMLHDCKVLHLVLLGDLFHGAIHTSARVASEELVCDQIMQVAEILAQAIGVLSCSVDRLYVYSTYGNHGRTVQNKNDSIHRDNIERLIPWWLRERLSGNKAVTVEAESDNEFLLVEAAGHDICAAHGDLDSVRNSATLLTTLFDRKYRRQIEYIILGDKHHRESFEALGVTATICGSLCGTDDYANSKRLFSTPSQLLLIVNPERGIDAEYRIKC